MKRSKIFLGITTCLLGVVAFAASKAKWNSHAAFYYTQANPSLAACKNLNVQIAFTTIKGSGSQYTTSTNGTPFYGTSKCEVELRNGGE